MLEGSPGNGVALHRYDRKVYVQKVFFRALLLSVTCTGQVFSNCFMVSSEILPIDDIPLVQLNLVFILDVLMRI